jgi:hypothetical protein
MTSIHRQRIDHPSAWTRQSTGGKEGLVYRLAPAHLDAFAELIARTRHLKPQEVTRADFRHPAIDGMLAEVWDIIQNGRGAAIVAGIAPERFSPEEFERIYWGIGTHWGTAATQSVKGDRLGRVTRTDIGPDNPTDRGYKSDRELLLHTDSHETVGLMCVEKAAEGGWSMLASSVAVFNRIVETRPDLLETCFEGYYMASKEASYSDKPLTEDKIPIFCYVDGKLSSLFHRIFYRSANKIRGDMPAPMEEAIRVFTGICDDPGFHVTYMLEPGEMMFINNFTCLHARTDFKDSAERKRCLLRLWLTPPVSRPMVEAYRKKAVGYGEKPAAAAE